MEYKKFVVLYGVFNTSDIINHRSKFGWELEETSDPFVMMKRDTEKIEQSKLDQERKYDELILKYQKIEKKTKIDKENIWIYFIFLFPILFYLGYKFYQKSKLKSTLNEILNLINQMN